MPRWTDEEWKQWRASQSWSAGGGRQGGGKNARRQQMEEAVATRAAEITERVSSRGMAQTTPTGSRAEASTTSQPTTPIGARAGSSSSASKSEWNDTPLAQDSRRQAASRIKAALAYQATLVDPVSRDQVEKQIAQDRIVARGGQTSEQGVAETIDAVARAEIKHGKAQKHLEAAKDLESTARLELNRGRKELEELLQEQKKAQPKSPAATKKALRYMATSLTALRDTAVFNEDGRVTVCPQFLEQLAGHVQLLGSPEKAANRGTGNTMQQPIVEVMSQEEEGIYDTEGDDTMTDPYGGGEPTQQPSELQTAWATPMSRMRRKTKPENVRKSLFSKPGDVRKARRTSDVESMSEAPQSA